MFGYLDARTGCQQKLELADDIGRELASILWWNMSFSGGNNHHASCLLHHDLEDSEETESRLLNPSGCGSEFSSSLLSKNTD